MDRHDPYPSQKFEGRKQIWKVQTLCFVRNKNTIYYGTFRCMKNIKHQIFTKSWDFRPWEGQGWIFKIHPCVSRAGYGSWRSILLGFSPLGSKDGSSRSILAFREQDMNLDAPFCFEKWCGTAPVALDRTTWIQIDVGGRDGSKTDALLMEISMPIPRLEKIPRFWKVRPIAENSKGSVNRG